MYIPTPRFQDAQSQFRPAKLQHSNNTTTPTTSRIVCRHASSLVLSSFITITITITITLTITTSITYSSNSSNSSSSSSSSSNTN